MTDAPPPAPSPRFIAGAFALALAAGFVAAVAALAQIAPGARARLWEPHRIWTGESARTVVRAVNDEFAPRKAFHGLERGLAWLTLRDWGPRVRAGCDGWLFLADELESHAAGGKDAALRAAIVQRLRAHLARQQIALLVVVVPDKTRIEVSRLCGLERAPHTNARVAAWVEGLRAHGVDAVDLTSILDRVPGERYYRTDTHWNERGAEAAAAAVAETLRARRLTTARAAAPAPLEPRRVERPGDLVRLAGLDTLPAALRPAAESVETRDVPPVAAGSDDLFGASALPSVVLVGTSFSRTAGFGAFLARHLGEQVANAAKEGGDFDGSAAAYVSSREFRESPPKVMVWEIPERALEPPATAAERRWLALLAAP